MEVKIISQEENKSLSRTEVKASIVYEGTTPSRKDIQKEIAKKLKAKEELTIIKTIKTGFGEAKATVYANAYTDENVLKRAERKNLVEKHAGHEPKKEEAAEE
ncbi:MAG: 30S ribosomal protein S24e [Nanobdellota archaeon]